MKKSAFISLLLTTMLISLSSAVFASKPVPKDVRYLLGMYYGNGSVFLVRENHGNLEIVYRTDSEDKDFSMANIFPLKKNHFEIFNQENILGFQWKRRCLQNRWKAVCPQFLSGRRK